MAQQIMAELQIAELAERVLLGSFWDHVRGGTPRLPLLLAFTRITITRAPNWNEEAVRTTHGTHHGLPDTIEVTKRRCFACDATAVLYAHHVIEIQNGGSNNVRNQVPLCFECHQFLHPWLTDDDRIEPPRRSGFESVGEIMRRTRIEGVDS